MQPNLRDIYQAYQSSSGIITDTRKIKKDCFFIALKGSRFNGNTFAKEALSKGAAYVVVDEEAYMVDDRCILVADGLQLLQELARHHRDQFSIPVIAITGSNGKTTTKELLAAILGTTYQTHFTQGNLNNHIGVPLTLLAMPLQTEVAIIEMGANHQREIAALCNIAKPTHGVITNIGKAHLEGFGGLEGVKKGKAELYDFLAANNGVAFINQDEAFLEDLATSVFRKIYYKSSPSLNEKNPVFELKLQQENPYLQVAILNLPGQSSIIETQLIGLYNFNNIMTAVAIGRYFKVIIPNIKKAVASYLPKNNRSEIRKIGTNTFLLDAYNANPSSMTAALDNFDTIKANKKLIILGDMLELGEFSAAAHQNILTRIGGKDVNAVVVGAYFKSGAQAQKVKHFPDVAALKSWFEKAKITDTYILLKGSRGIGLEKLLA